MAAVNKNRQEVLSEYRCAQILDAARKVFAKKGFAATKVEDISSAAGIAKGTLYLYYRSKRDIYLAALRKGILALYEETRRNVDRAQSVQEKLRAFIFTRLHYFEENRNFFRIYHSDLGSLLTTSGGVSKNFKDLQEKQAQLLDTVLKEGIEQRLIRPLQTTAASFAIYDMTRALIARRLLSGERVKADRDAEFLIDLVWKGIVQGSKSKTRKAGR